MYYYENNYYKLACNKVPIHFIDFRLKNCTEKWTQIPLQKHIAWNQQMCSGREKGNWVIMRTVKRKNKDDGTAWVGLGDRASKNQESICKIERPSKTNKCNSN